MMDHAVTAFSDFAQPGNLLIFVVLLNLLALALWPFFALAHELGHACVGLLRTEGVVVATVGSERARLEKRFGRLVIRLSLIPARGKPRGIARTYAVLRPGERIASSLAGPMAQIVASLVLTPVVVITSGVTRVAFVFVLGSNAVSALSNLVPRTSKSGLANDGKNLIQAFRNRQSDPRLISLDGSSTQNLQRELKSTWSRWFAVFTSPASSLPREGFDLLLFHACVWDGNTKTETRAASSRLAYAGWCWRECERGDIGRVADMLRALWAEAATSPREARLIATAQFLSTNERFLAEASPGDSQRERRAFLKQALRLLPRKLRTSSLNPQRQRSSFLYGVALHDLELLFGENAESDYKPLTRDHRPNR